MEEILKDLENKRDEKYAQFSKNIVPGFFVYVRIPEIKKISKKYANTQIGEKFLNSLPHQNVDQNNLHGIMLGDIIQDQLASIKRIEEFLPYINNWEVCDCTCANLKIVKKYPIFFKKYIKKWLKSKNNFTKRFAVVLLIDYYLDKNFCKEDLDLINLYGEDYYVNMAIAWYYSVALIKQYDHVIKYFENGKIKNKWVHNKSIQKAIESFRIDENKKIYLKSLKL